MKILVCVLQIQSTFTLCISIATTSFVGYNEQNNYYVVGPDVFVITVVLM